MIRESENPSIRESTVEASVEIALQGSVESTEPPGVILREGYRTEAFRVASTDNSTDNSTKEASSAESPVESTVGPLWKYLLTLSQQILPSPPSSPPQGLAGCQL